MESCTGRSSSRIPSNLPDTSGSTATIISGEILQDMIREKRAQAQNLKKTKNPLDRATRVGRSEHDHRDTQSSPLAPTSGVSRPAMVSRRSSGMNGKPAVQKEMGLREMQEHISRIDKQNFDLKLEVFHRRQRGDQLEQKVEELQAVEAGYDELQARHDALLLEFDRQKLVLDDAVLHICELQGENEELQAELGGRISEATMLSRQHNCLSSVASSPSPGASTGNRAQGIELDNQPRTGGDRNTAISPSTWDALQTPTATLSCVGTNGDTFEPDQSHGLNDNRHGQNLLTHNISRSSDGISVDEEDDHLDEKPLNSPRLSILSESGFSSIYGGLGNSLRDHQPPEEERRPRGPSPSEKERKQLPLSSQREARINNWMQDKAQPTTPLTQKSLRKAPSTRFVSIGEVLKKSPSYERPLETMQPSQLTQSSPRNASSGQWRPHPKSPIRPSAAARTRSYSSSYQSSNIGGRMPPTPETMSTATVGANSSSQSIITEKSLYDHSQHPSKGYASLVAYGQPGSAETSIMCSQINKGLGIEKALDKDLGSEAPIEDDEVQSTQVESGDCNSGSGRLGPLLALPFMGSHIDPSDVVGVKKYCRPPLMHHMTSSANEGEGFAVVQPSRTISYPSSQSANRRAKQLSPQGQRSFATHEQKSESSTKEIPGSAKFSATPTEFSTEKQQQSPDKSLERRNVAVAAKQVDQDTEYFPERRDSRRFNLFRRSNSHTANYSIETNLAKRPRPIRSHSSTRTQPRLPNVSIFHSVRPGTSDGSHINDMHLSDSSTDKRRHSTILQHASSLLPRTSMSHERSSYRIPDAKSASQVDDNRSSRWPMGRVASARLKGGLGLRKDTRDGLIGM